MTRPTDGRAAGSPPSGGAPEMDGPGGAGAPPLAATIDVEGAPEPLSGRERRGRRVLARCFQGDRAPEDVSLDDVGALVRDDRNILWIDIAHFEPADLRRLEGVLHLDRNAVRAALSSWHQPRLLVDGDRFFVSATVAEVAPATRRVRAGQLSLFVGRNYLLSVHREKLPFFDRIAFRADQSPDLVLLDSAFMLYIVLDEMLDFYDGLTDHLEEEIEAMEERALADTGDPFLEDLLRLKRYVFAVGRLAAQHRDVFTSFLRPDFRFVAGHEVEPYYRDLVARLERLQDRSNAARDSVNGAFDIYVSHVAHRTNQVMKILTVVSTVVIPATIILGVFGTSFDDLPIYDPGWFGVMLGATLLLTAVVLLAFRWKKWL